MVFVANSENNWEAWDFITGSSDMSILIDRYYYLEEMNKNNDGLKLSFRDPDTNKWTKWGAFPGKLVKHTGSNKWDRSYYLDAAVDVHRSVLEHEIVIESDYPAYEKNYEASKIIGAILEKKGFIPHYYYSGSKSVHIHVYLDFKFFLDIDLLLQEQILVLFSARTFFVKAFMKWIRGLMIRCWDTGVREFDEALVRSTHLIRAELSRNKKGYKCFLGYSHKDLSFIPYICNENNRIYPRIGQIRLSKPHKPQELVEEFLEGYDKAQRIVRLKRKETSLHKWMGISTKEEIRGCVKFILSDEFKEAGDGTKRGMFIIANELKKVLGENQALIILNDWNKRMEWPVKTEEIEYRVNSKIYDLSCDFIHSFLDSLGFDVSEKCNGKLFK